MFTIADAHCDTLRSVGVYGKDITECTVTPDEMKKGGVALQTFAMFAGAEGPGGKPCEEGKMMLAARDRMGVPIFDGKLPEAFPDGPSGIVSIEGGEMLVGSLEKLHEFNDECRIRMIALTWNNENEIAHPAKNGPEGGLKPFGREFVREMDKLGILADVSHLNEAGFWDLMELAELPPIATHSNNRELCDVPRNLRKEQIRAIIERKGFIGMNFYSCFLAKDRPAAVEDVLRHIDSIAQMGGIDVLGFGSDFDGIDEWPDDLGKPSDFPALIERLLKAGYTEADVEKIAHGNLWRVLKLADK